MVRSNMADGAMNEPTVSWYSFNYFDSMDAVVGLHLSHLLYRMSIKFDNVRILFKCLYHLTSEDVHREEKLLYS